MLPLTCHLSLWPEKLLNDIHSITGISSYISPMILWKFVGLKWINVLKKYTHAFRHIAL